MVPLLQRYKRIPYSIVSVQYGLYVKTLLSESNQRMPGSNLQKFVIVAFSIIKGLYPETKSYPVCRAPDWQSRQLLCVISIEIPSGYLFREFFMSMLIFPTKIIDKSVEANVVEESGGVEHSVPISTHNFTFLLLKIEVVTSPCLLTAESTRSLISNKILYKL